MRTNTIFPSGLPDVNGIRKNHEQKGEHAHDEFECHLSTIASSDFTGTCCGEFVEANPATDCADDTDLHGPEGSERTGIRRKREVAGDSGNLRTKALRYGEEPKAKTIETPPRKIDRKSV